MVGAWIGSTNRDYQSSYAPSWDNTDISVSLYFPSFFIGIILVMRTLKYSLNDIGFNLNNILIQILLSFEGMLLGPIGFLILLPQAFTQSLSFSCRGSPNTYFIVRYWVYRGDGFPRSYAAGCPGFGFVGLVIYRLLSTPSSKS